MTKGEFYWRDEGKRKGKKGVYGRKEILLGVRGNEGNLKKQVSLRALVQQILPEGLESLRRRAGGSESLMKRAAGLESIPSRAGGPESLY